MVTLGDAPARPVRWPVVVAIAPLLAAFGVAVAQLAGWLVGVHPFWPLPELNLAEAAATSDTGEAYRLIVYEKHDIDAVLPVRPGMLSQTAARLTPLEAAVEARRFQMVRLLLYYGAAFDAAKRATLICRAVALADPETVDFLLTTGDGSDPRASCASAPPHP